MRRFFNCSFTFLVLTFGFTGAAQTQTKETPRYSVIQVEKMHCDGCAARIGGKVREVANVGVIQYDVQKKLLWVHPKDGQQLSPRALWEAVERANDRPVQLFTPTGTFTKKPQS